MKLQLIDYAIIVLYFLFVIGIGFLLKRRVKTGNDFLMSNRSIPLWITSLAFISANLSGQEVLAMAARTSQAFNIAAIAFIVKLPCHGSGKPVYRTQER